MKGSNEKAKLGELLLEAGLITKDQLDIALSNQREWGGKLGSILVNMGFVKEKKLGEFLSHQFNIPNIDLGSIRIKNDTLKLVRKDIAEKYMLIPVAYQKTDNVKRILVAMSDPLDLRAIDDIQFSTGMKVKAGIAPEGAIWRAIQIYYYDNKAVTADFEPSVAPIKIDMSEIDDKLEIFREGSVWDKPKPEPFMPQSIDDISIELKALKNLLVKKGILTLSEFYLEVKKFRE